jgi:hypothetical protein
MAYVLTSGTSGLGAGLQEVLSRTTGGEYVPSERAKQQAQLNQMLAYARQLSTNQAAAANRPAPSLFTPAPVDTGIPGWVWLLLAAAGVYWFNSRRRQAA